VLLGFVMKHASAAFTHCNQRMVRSLEVQLASPCFCTAGTTRADAEPSSTVRATSTPLQGNASEIWVDSLLLKLKRFSPRSPHLNDAAQSER